MASWSCRRHASRGLQDSRPLGSYKIKHPAFGRGESIEHDFQRRVAVVRDVDDLRLQLITIDRGKVRPSRLHVWIIGVPRRLSALTSYPGKEWLFSRPF